MTVTAGVGPMLRDWRRHRRLSQLDLAIEAEVSARHLSFVETVNTLRVSLHPGGLAPRIGNFAEYSAHLLHRIDRSAVITADSDLTALADELRGYPGVTERSAPPDAAAMLFVPLILRSGDQKLAFFSTIATFGTALDITAAELAIESFFPADEQTAIALRDAWS